jgi:enterochelin esterase-like enzyme
MNPQLLAALFKAPPARAPRVTIAAGAYDIPLIDDARALRRELESRRVPVDWLEVPEGHNHTAWRAQLQTILASWFPPGGAAGDAGVTPRGAR